MANSISVHVYLSSTFKDSRSCDTPKDFNTQNCLELHLLSEKLKFTFLLKTFSNWDN